jgi:hypothetical protein
MSTNNNSPYQRLTDAMFVQTGNRAALNKAMVDAAHEVVKAEVQRFAEGLQAHPMKKLNNKSVMAYDVAEVKTHLANYMKEQ